MDLSTTNGKDIRDQRCTIWGVSGFLVWENGHVWPMQSDVLAIRRLRMVVNVAGGVD